MCPRKVQQIMGEHRWMYVSTTLSDEFLKKFPRALQILNFRHRTSGFALVCGSHHDCRGPQMAWRDPVGTRSHGARGVFGPTIDVAARHCSCAETHCHVDV